MISKSADFTDLNAGIIEGIFAFAIVLVVLNTSTAKANRGNSFYGMAYGGVHFAGVLLAGAISGGVFNPAVCLGGYIGRAAFNSNDFDGLAAFEAGAWTDQFEGAWLGVGVGVGAGILAGWVYKACVTGGFACRRARKVGKGVGGCCSKLRKCCECTGGGADGHVERDSDNQEMFALGEPSAPQDDGLVGIGANSPMRRGVRV